MFMKLLLEIPSLKAHFEPFNIASEFFTISKKSSKMTQNVFFLVELELFSGFKKVSGQYETLFPRYTSLKSFEYMAEILKFTPGFSGRMKNIRKSPIF